MARRVRKRAATPPLNDDNPQLFFSTLSTADETTHNKPVPPLPSASTGGAAHASDARMARGGGDTVPKRRRVEQSQGGLVLPRKFTELAQMFDAVTKVADLRLRRGEPPLFSAIVAAAAGVYGKTADDADLGKTIGVEHVQQMQKIANDMIRYVDRGRSSTIEVLRPANESSHRMNPMALQSRRSREFRKRLLRITRRYYQRFLNGLPTDQRPDHDAASAVNWDPRFNPNSIPDIPLPGAPATRPASAAAAAAAAREGYHEGNNWETQVAHADKVANRLPGAVVRSLDAGGAGTVRAAAAGVGGDPGDPPPPPASRNAPVAAPTSAAATICGVSTPELVTPDPVDIRCETGDAIEVQYGSAWYPAVVQEMQGARGSGAPPRKLLTVSLARLPSSASRAASKPCRLTSERSARAEFSGLKVHVHGWDAATDAWEPLASTRLRQKQAADDPTAPCRTLPMPPALAAVMAEHRLDHHTVTGINVLVKAKEVALKTQRREDLFRVSQHTLTVSGLPLLADMIKFHFTSTGRTAMYLDELAIKLLSTHKKVGVTAKVIDDQLDLLIRHVPEWCQLSTVGGRQLFSVCKGPDAEQVWTTVRPKLKGLVNQKRVEAASNSGVKVQ